MPENRLRRRVELLEHLLRVCEDKQWLFNSFHLSLEEIRRYNMKCEVVQFSMDKLKLIYDVNNLVRANLVNEKILYQLNERLKIIFTRNTRSRHILDQHVLTAALIDLLINVCKLIEKSETRMLNMVLTNSIESLIDDKFLKPYCYGLLLYTKNGSLDH